MIYGFSLFYFIYVESFFDDVTAFDQTLFLWCYLLLEVLIIV